VHIIARMRLREPGTKSILLVLVVLLLLLPLLAVLQYRWQSQLSEREQEHMKLNLRAIAQRFEQDFDDEIARAYAVFFLPSDQAADENLVEYAKRHDRWLSVAQHPKLVKDLFVVRAAKGGGLYLSRLDIEQRQFARVEWPAHLAPLRIQFEKFLGDEPRPSMRELMTNRIRQLNEGEVALINPSFAPSGTPPRSAPASPSLAAFVVVVVNRDEIEQEMLPALARRHFAGTQALDYGAEVVGPAPEHKLIYHFGADVPGKAEPDVEVGLLGLGRDSFRRVIASLPVSEPILTSPRVVAQSDRQVSAGQNSGRPRWAEAGRLGVGEDEPRLWELRLTHRSGSLEAAVVSIRRRNLLISFGILLLLGASVALMMISARRAQLLARRQLDFVAGVSHELRTPLAVIKSAAWSLTRGVVKDPSGIKRYSELIGNESDRLIEMIEQVLEYAGARSGNQKLELQPTDVSHLIHEVLAAAQPLLTEGRFEVEKRITPDLPLVLAQAPALSRALRNLIDNAMKYSGESRWIGISAETTGSSSKGEVRISINDRGPGIPADEIRHIFDPFWRGSEATAAQIHGNGLGLNLVKTIVEAHQGDVVVRSTPGNGSSFSIVLPALREEMPDSSPAAVHSLESDAAR
jgi:two-component system, OmpR family, sensor histidine kinase SenX3